MTAFTGHLDLIGPDRTAAGAVLLASTSRAVAEGSVRAEGPARSKRSVGAKGAFGSEYALGSEKARGAVGAAVRAIAVGIDLDIDVEVLAFGMIGDVAFQRLVAVVFSSHIVTPFRYD